MRSNASNPGAVTLTPRLSEAKGRVHPDTPDTADTPMRLTPLSRYICATMPAMKHENIPSILSDMEARLVNIRDSL